MAVLIGGAGGGAAHGACAGEGAAQAALRVAAGSRHANGRELGVLVSELRRERARNSRDGRALRRGSVVGIESVDLGQPRLLVHGGTHGGCKALCLALQRVLVVGSRNLQQSRRLHDLRREVGDVRILTKRRRAQDRPRPAVGLELLRAAHDVQPPLQHDGASVARLALFKRRRLASVGDAYDRLAQQLLERRRGDE